MLKIWADQAWEDYLYWKDNEKKNVKKINRLIKEIERHPFTGLGKPEPLKHEWKGYWSRHITQEHRLVYKVENDSILIAQARFHY
ncbi:Txe/YoeB family addiction module toxin [Planococcus massiliensis]|uniref:Txe/YoeB family addiction module toxin n=1 Tax=Planococcus massiliensis TaxID=1499687 RepID=UPI000695DB9D|nr:Txe/YoeB family addiction module toxin [Planococcus massiliensis]